MVVRSKIEGHAEPRTSFTDTANTLNTNKKTKPEPGSLPSRALQAVTGVPPEPFVDAQKAAEFLSMRPRRLLELARQGAIPAYPLGNGYRRVWRFRLSELAAAIEARINCAWQFPAPKGGN